MVQKEILNQLIHMGVSKIRGTPKSSILIGFSLINHPFWGTTIFGNTHMVHKLHNCFLRGFVKMSGGEGRSSINSIGGGISLASKGAPLVSVLRRYLMCIYGL